MVQVEGVIRTRGRPKMTWIDVEGKCTGVYNFTEDIALNRVEWQKRIHVTLSSWDTALLS